MTTVGVGSLRFRLNYGLVKRREKKKKKKKKKRNGVGELLRDVFPSFSVASRDSVSYDFVF